MTKHPLYEIFQSLTEGKPREFDSFQPVPVEHFAINPLRSTEYKKMGCLVLAGGGMGAG